MFSTFKAARMLGWASIAVGVTELVATQWIEETIGVKDHGPLIKAYGLREVAAGATLLNQVGLNKPLVGGLWSRVAGDAIDILTLASVSKRSNRGSGLSTTTALVLTLTGLDLLVACVAQADLIRGERISAAARDRVRPTVAVPGDGDHRVPAAAVYVG